LAIPVAGPIDPDLGHADFVALGAALAVPAKAVLRVLGELTERVEVWLPRLSSLPFDRARITKLRRVIEHRRRRLTPAHR
jgi:hypothetical protein